MLSESEFKAKVKPFCVHASFVYQTAIVLHLCCTLINGISLHSDHHSPLR